PRSQRPDRISVDRNASRNKVIRQADRRDDSVRAWIDLQDRTCLTAVDRTDGPDGARASRSRLAVDRDRSDRRPRVSIDPQQPCTPEFNVRHPDRAFSRHEIGGAEAWKL